MLERAQQSSSQGPCHEVVRLRIPVLVDDLSARADWPIYRDRAEALLSAGRFGGTDAAGSRSACRAMTDSSSASSSEMP